jgi:hypothetical protein
MQRDETLDGTTGLREKGRFTTMGLSQGSGVRLRHLLRQCLRSGAWAVALIGCPGLRTDRSGKVPWHTASRPLGVWAAPMGWRQACYPRIPSRDRPSPRTSGRTKVFIFQILETMFVSLRHSPTSEVENAWREPCHHLLLWYMHLANSKVTISGQLVSAAPTIFRQFRTFLFPGRNMWHCCVNEY